MGYVNTFADQMMSGRPAAKAAGALFSNPIMATSVLLASACITFFSVKALVGSDIFNPPNQSEETVSYADIIPVQPTHDYTTEITTTTTTTTTAATTTTTVPTVAADRFVTATLLWPTGYPRIHVEGLPLPAEFGDGLLDAEAVFCLLNQVRVNNGMTPFKRAGSDLGNAARLRAGELLISFSQIRPDGTGYATAFTESGVRYEYTMESVGYGQYTAEHIVSDWMKSDENMRNILDPLCENVYIYCLVGQDNIPVWVMEGYSLPQNDAQTATDTDAM